MFEIYIAVVRPSPFVQNEKITGGQNYWYSKGESKDVD